MNAIVVMVIGTKYEAIFEATREQFERYAQKCGAQLEICRSPPDPSMQGHLLTQKMLLPKIYSHYKWIAFMDLDILISKNAPSIFDFVDNSKGFGGVLDPFGEKAFFKANQFWFNCAPEEITKLEDRFLNEGFAFNKKITGIINGGIWLAKPMIVGDLFSEYYFRHAKKDNFYEEIPMSFLTQNAGMFFSLDRRFNNQMIYFSCEKNALLNYFLISAQKKFNQIIKKLIPNKEFFLFLPPYISLVENYLESSFILHFSGGHPIPKKLRSSIVNFSKSSLINSLR